MKYEVLRKKYPKFVYKKYSYQISDKNLEIFFDFRIEPDIFFQPKVVIENVKESQIKSVGKGVLDNLVFNLGLIEMLSYWKATSAPEIIVNAGYLNLEQIKWWKDLIMKGMSQFFYENKIDFLKPNFLKIISNVTRKDFVTNVTRKDFVTLKEGVLVPVGGGKDSVVTLELLKKTKKNIKCFSLNPTEAADEIMKMSDCKKPIIVRRRIDEKLLELNRQGFLNGHTPFSAYLAFLSILLAVIFDQKYIAFSNERSSNEGNLKYLGRTINHQWSKSFEFEQKFRKYCRKYLTPGVKEDKSSFPPSLPLRGSSVGDENKVFIFTSASSGSSVVEYFSFLRPLYEIQIAKLFSKYPKYFNAFLSCNEAFKTASGTKLPTKKWCGKCPKCLFVFASLYLFVETKKLIKIFRKNLFEDPEGIPLSAGSYGASKKLLPIMRQLIGEEKFKPFECVGTKKESLIAFYLSWKKYRGQTSANLPFLLEYFQNKILPKYKNLEKESIKILNSWSNQHYLPKKFEEILKSNFP